MKKTSRITPETAERLAAELAGKRFPRASSASRQESMKQVKRTDNSSVRIPGYIRHG